MTISLTLAAAAALINLWLSLRIGMVRRSSRINTGDGGHEPLTLRMRAQANFIENTPFVLILIALIEYREGSGFWLLLVGWVYMVARIAHALGMDGGRLALGRMIGTLVTMLTLSGLATVALYLSYVPAERSAPAITLSPTNGLVARS